MKKTTAPIATVDDYISSYPAPVQAALRKVQKTVLAAARGATEGISYGLPTVKLGGRVVIHYGAFQHHIGLYATPTGHAAFAERLKDYKQGKGSVQFPFSEALPLDLISDIAAFRWRQVTGTASIKAQTKAAAKLSRQKKLTAEEAVAAYMEALPTTTKQALNAVRKIIMQASSELQERIKWSAPSYHYKKADIITFGPYKGKDILLVVHHPSVVTLSSPLLRGTYRDRRLIRFGDKHEALAAKEELQRIIREIIQSIDSITNKNKSHAKTTI